MNRDYETYQEINQKPASGDFNIAGAGVDNDTRNVNRDYETYRELNQNPASGDFNVAGTPGDRNVTNVGESYSKTNQRGDSAGGTFLSQPVPFSETNQHPASGDYNIKDTPGDLNTTNVGTGAGSGAFRDDQPNYETFSETNQRPAAGEFNIAETPSDRNVTNIGGKLSLDPGLGGAKGVNTGAFDSTGVDSTGVEPGTGSAGIGAGGVGAGATGAGAAGAGAGASGAGGFGGMARSAFDKGKTYAKENPDELKRHGKTAFGKISLTLDPKKN